MVRLKEPTNRKARTWLSTRVTQPAVHEVDEAFRELSPSVDCDQKHLETKVLALMMEGEED